MPWLFCFLTGIADTIEIQGVVADFVFHNCSHGLFDLMDPWIAIFFDPAANGANDVIMLFAGISLFKLSNVLTELVLDHQPAVKQQFHGIIQGGTAHPVTVVLHMDIQLFHIEMAIPDIHLVENSKPFGSFPMTFPLNIIGEDLFYNGLYVITLHGINCPQFFQPDSPNLRL